MNSSRIADVQMYSDFQKQRLALARGQRTKYFGGKGIETIETRALTEFEKRKLKCR